MSAATGAPAAREAAPREPAMETRITRLLGIRYPIIQGGMQWVGRAELASAVSNAGGLGILTGLTQPTPDALSREIERCRSMTRAPFGVNLTMLPSVNPPPHAAYLDAIVAGGVRIMETAGNVPEAFFAKIKAAGITVLHKCVAVRHALAAERRGVDAISIDGFECAGHPGDDDIPGMILIPAAAARVRIPIIASGGIGTGSGMAAALCLGAEGVNMGTRFCATREAPIHDNIKQGLVRSSERATNIVMRGLRNTARVLKNKVSDEIVEIERSTAAPLEYEQIRHLVSGQRGRQALETGALDDGIVWAGQVVGLIDDIPSCEELIQRMVRECRERLETALRSTRPH
jgi:nitronate monooxygenase